MNALAETLQDVRRRIKRNGSRPMNEKVHESRDKPVDHARMALREMRL